MKLKTILGIVGPILACILCAYLGYTSGFQEGQQDYSLLGVPKLQELLKEKEGESISEYLNSKASVDTRDEGGLFTTKYVKYFDGHISNNAHFAEAKNVVLRVEFFENQKVLGEEKITISEFIPPQGKVNFRKQLSFSNSITDFKFYIENAEYR